jgi:hypothetical protein
MDIDFTWANPTEAQNVALDIAIKQKPHTLTEFQAAEFICMADSSLWYTQAKSWAEKPPIAGNSTIAWRAACKIILNIVDLGYDEQQKTWWPMTKLGTADEIATKMLILMDFGMMLKQYRQQSMAIVSTGLEVFLDIVLGNNWEKKFKKILAEKAAPKQPKIRPCINPFCDLEVDTVKRKSGACSQEHLRYYCSKCKRWHHWGTKIADQHKEFYVCDWSKEAASRVKDGLSPI